MSGLWGLPRLGTTPSLSHTVSSSSLLDVPSSPTLERSSSILDNVSPRTSIGSLAMRTQRASSSLGTRALPSVGEEVEEGQSPRIAIEDDVLSNAESSKDRDGQLKTMREQLASFSREMVQMRSEMKNLRGRKEVLQNEIASEVKSRQEFGVQCENSIKSMMSEFDAMRRNITNNANTLREGRDESSQKIASLDERLSKAVDDLRKQQQLALEAFETAERERTKSENKVRTMMEQQLMNAIDAQKHAREEACGRLDTEIKALRKSLEEETRKSSSYIKEQSVLVETNIREISAVEASVLQLERSLRSELESETKSRNAADMQTQKLMEDLAVKLNSQVGDMVKQLDIPRIRSDIEKEGMERAKAMENMRRSTEALTEQSDRRHAEAGEAHRRALEQESFRHDQARAELERQLKAVSAELAGVEKARTAALEQQTKNTQQLILNQAADSKKASDEALERGLKALYQSLEKGFEKAENSRLELSAQFTKLLDAAAHQGRIELETQMRKNHADRKEEMQEIHNRAMESLANEKAIREEAHAEMKASEKKGQEALRNYASEQIEKAAEARKHLEEQIQEIRSETHKSRTENEAKLREIKDMVLQLDRESAQKQVQANKELSEKNASSVEALNARLIGMQDGLRNAEAALKEAYDKLSNEQKDLKRNLESTMRDDMLALAGASNAYADGHKEAVFKRFDQFERDIQSALKDTHSTFGAMSNEKAAMQEAALQESHRALATELRAHKSEAETTTRGLFEKEREVRQAAHDGIARSLDELIANVRGDVQKLAELGEERNKNTKEMLISFNDDHNEKHVRNRREIEENFANALASTQNKLQQDQQAMLSGFDGNHKNLKDVVTELSRALESTDGMLQKEQKLRTDAEERMVKALSDIRKEHEVLLQDSQTGLRKELTEIAANEREIKASMNETFRQLKHELIETRRIEQQDVHDAVLKERETREKGLEALKRMLAEMDEKYRVDLQKHSEGTNEKHVQTRELLRDLQDQTQNRTVKNAADLEQSFKDSLAASQQKLHEELAALKSAADGSHFNLREILTEVTKEVEVLSNDLAQEQKSRLAVEDRMDKKCLDLNRDIQDALKEAHAALRLELAEKGKSAEEVQAALQEAHRALKKELNDHKLTSAQEHRDLLSKERHSQDEIHKAHKQSVAQMEEKLRTDMRALVDSHDQKMGDLKDQLQDINGDHMQRHLQNSKEFEDALSNAVANTHNKLSEEVNLLKSGMDGTHGGLKQVLTEVAQQVEALAADLGKEQKARLAVEDRTDKTCRDLQHSMSEALKEAHAALKAELAAAGKNTEEVKAALNDARKTLKTEMKEIQDVADKTMRDLVGREGQARAEIADLCKKSFTDMEQKFLQEVQALESATEKRHGEMRNIIDANHDLHMDKHAQAAQKHEDAVSGAIDSTHKKLQEELEILKSGVDGKHGNLREVLMEVTKQVDVLDQTMKMEQETRRAAEEQLGKTCSDVRREVNESLKESQAALKLELAALGRDGGAMQSAMEEAHKALKKDLNDHKMNSEKVTRDLIVKETQARGADQDVQRKTLAEMEQKLRTDLQALADTSNKKHGDLKGAMDAFCDANNKQHVQNAKAAEEGISAALATMHKKLQDELAALKGGVDGNHGNLRGILVEVTQQVDLLDQNLQNEQKARLAVEDNLNKSCIDMRRDIDEALKESHAALKLEMAALDKNGEAMKAAMQEAHKALKQELGNHKENMEKTTRDLIVKNQQAHDQAGDVHKKAVGEMEKKLRGDLQKLAENADKKHGELTRSLEAVHEEHKDKHVQNARALEEGISGALSTSHQKLQEELALLKGDVGGSHGNLRDVLMEVTKQVDNLDQVLQNEQKARVAVEDRLDKSCSEMRKDLDTAMAETHAALRMELAEHAKNGQDMNAAMQQAQNALKKELNDHKLDSEAATRDLLKKEQQARGEHADLHKKNVRELEAKLREEMKQHADNHAKNHSDLQRSLEGVHAEHKDKHLQHSRNLEEGIAGALGQTHKKLQEELELLKSGIDGTHGNLRDILVEVTKQVDNLDASFQKEQKERLTEEQRLEKACSDLRRDVDESMKEAHAALKLELAALGKNSDEMKAAMQEAHTALKEELNDHKAASEDSHDLHKQSLAEMEAKLKQDLQQVADDHKDNHAKLKQDLQQVAGEHQDNHELLKQNLQQIADDHKDNHAKLKQDLQQVADDHKDNHEQMKRSLDDVHDHHVEKHAQNARALEDGISSALANTHAKLAEELGLLKNGVDGSHGSLRDVLMEVTKQVDLLDETVQKEHKARMAVEEKLDKSCNDMRRDIDNALQESQAALRMELAALGKNSNEMQAAMQEAHNALKKDLNDHKDNSAKATRDLLAKEQQTRGEHLDSHKKNMKEMEDRLRNDLKKVADSHEKKHADVKDALNAVNDQHHQKHSSHAKALEEGISGAMDKTHKKLQEELSILKNGITGNHDILKDVLTEVTKQVDTIDQTLKQESKARLATEEALGKTCQDLRRDINDALQESHAALKLELAALGKNGEEMKSAMQEAHSALKQELDDHKDESEKARGEHRDLHQQTLSEMEAQLKKDMQKIADDHEKRHGELKDAVQSVNDEHHEKHSQHAANLENGISNALDATHQKLQEELALLRDDHSSNHGNLKEVLIEVTKQVDRLDEAVQQEQKARIAVEGDLEKKCGDMRRDIDEALKESHAALKLELAALDKNGSEMRAAMQEAHEALKQEFNDHKDDFNDHKESTGDAHDAHKDALSQMEAKLREDLQKVNDDHHDKHSQNAAALENGISSALDSTHQKLQEELALLKSGVNDNHGSLRDVLIEVTKSVDKLDQTLEEEQKARLAVEDKLDKQCTEMRREIDDVLKDHKDGHAMSLEQLKDGHATSLQALEEKLRSELQQVSDDHHALHAEHQARHTAGEEAREAGLQSVLHNAHSKLAEELEALKSGVDGNHGSLREIVADLCKQVDIVTSSVEDESKMRLEVEERLGKACDDLRTDLDVAIKEAHAALRLELAEHGKNSDEMKAAMEEANSALKAEIDSHRTTLDDKLGAHADMHDGHAMSMKELEDRLRGELQQVHEEHTEKHAQNSSALENGISNALDSTHAKLQEEIALLKSGHESGHGSLREIMTEIASQVDIIDQTVQKEQQARLAVEDRLDKSCEELRKDVNDSLKESHAALQLELAALNKNGDEMKAAMMDAHKALKDELNDHKEDSAKAHQDNLNSLEDQLRRDLQKVADGHDDKHQEVKSMLKALDDQHKDKHDEHAQNAAALEDGLKNTLQGSHEKLQEELKLLKEGHEGNHGSLREILTEVTQQVDILEQTLQSEQKLRLAVEERLDKELSGMHRDIDEAMKEAHAAIHMELANQSNDKEEMKKAMQEAHQALKAEFDDHKDHTERTTRELVEPHKETMAEMEQKLRQDLGQLSDGHHDKHHETRRALEEMSQQHQKHAENAKALEDGLTNAVDQVHQKLQEELGLLKAGVNEGHGSIREVLQDLIQQVDNLDGALQEEQKLRLSVEGKLDEMYNGLKVECQDALNEAHAALRMELASQGNDKEELKAAMQEAHEALKAELADHKDEFQNHRNQLEDNHGLIGGKLGDVEKYLQEAVADMSQKHEALAQAHRDNHAALHEKLHGTIGEHADKHASHREELERGLHDTIGKTHDKLAADLAELQSGHADNIEVLKKVLEDVTKQVEALTDELNAESGLRKEMEQNLQLQCDLMKDEIHSTLHDRHSELEQKLRDHHEGQLSDVEQKLKAAMEDLDAKHEARHQDSANHAVLSDMFGNHEQKLEAGLDDVLAKTHAKLAEDLAMLKSGHDDSHGSLKDVVADVAKEVDALTFSLETEKGLRNEMEEKLRENIGEIRQELEDLFKEAHAALRLELASQNQDAEAIKAAMQDAHEALKGELADHKGRLDFSTTDHLDRHEDMKSRVSSEVNLLRSSVESTNSMFRDRLAELTGQIDALNASLHAEQAVRSDHEGLLEQRTAALEHKMRAEIQENLDEQAAKHREVTRELRDSIHNFNNEGHARHLKLQGMIDSHLQGVISNADLKLRRALEELKEGIDAHHSAVRDHIGQERATREQAEHNMNAKIQDTMRSLREETDALSMKRDRSLNSLGNDFPGGWQEEVKRLWEAIDTHTHDVAVEDIEEDRTTTIIRPLEVPTQVPVVMPGINTFSVNRGIPAPLTQPLSLSSPRAQTRVIQQIPSESNLLPLARASSPTTTGFERTVSPRLPGSFQQPSQLGSASIPTATMIQSTPNLGASRQVSLVMESKCGNCPNMLKPEENFCRKCGWEKPMHGPLPTGTQKILHNA